MLMRLGWTVVLDARSDRGGIILEETFMDLGMDDGLDFHM